MALGAVSSAFLHLGGPPIRRRGVRYSNLGQYDPCAAVYGCEAPKAGEESGDTNEPATVVGVGVVGCGRIGLVHLDTLSRASGARVVIVSNPTVSKAEEAARKYGVAEWTSSAEEVIKHPDVEAVWICSPSSYHAEQINLCAAEGKHAFCEKPLATSLTETISSIRAMERAGLKLMTALQRRFDPSFQRIKTGILMGEIGEPIVVKLCSRDPAPPPASYVKGGGGIFKDMAIHDLDLSRFLMASEPIEVMASGSNCVSPEIRGFEGPEKYDTAHMIVRFANGREAIIDVCRQAPYGYDQRAEVLGTKGMLSTDNVFPTPVSLYTRERVGHADHPYDFFMSRYREAYAAETRAFVQALVEDRPVPCSGQDGLVALVLAMAAGVSAQEKRWVSFAEIIGESDEHGGAWIRRVRSMLGKDIITKADVSQAFKLIDPENNGITPWELKDVLNRLGEYPSDSEISGLIDVADLDKDGKISKLDFEDLFSAYIKTTSQ